MQHEAAGNSGAQATLPPSAFAQHGSPNGYFLPTSDAASTCEIAPLAPAYSSQPSYTVQAMWHGAGPAIYGAPAPAPAAQPSQPTAAPPQPALSDDGRKRLRWSAALHTQFVAAVHQLGGPFQATPKRILALMAQPGLTLFHIKSHLQKYRNALSERTTPAPKKATKDGKAHGKDGGHGDGGTGATHSLQQQQQPPQQQHGLGVQSPAMEAIMSLGELPSPSSGFPSPTWPDGGSDAYGMHAMHAVVTDDAAHRAAGAEAMHGVTGGKAVHVATDGGVHDVTSHGAMQAMADAALAAAELPEPQRTVSQEDEAPCGGAELPVAARGQPDALVAQHRRPLDRQLTGLSSANQPASEPGLSASSLRGSPLAHPRMQLPAAAEAPFACSPRLHGAAGSFDASPRMHGAAAHFDAPPHMRSAASAPASMLESALRVQLEMQRQLSSTIEAQHRLQMQLEAHGRYIAELLRGEAAPAAEPAPKPAAARTKAASRASSKPQTQAAATHGGAPPTHLQASLQQQLARTASVPQRPSPHPSFHRSASLPSSPAPPPQLGQMPAHAHSLPLPPQLHHRQPQHQQQPPMQQQVYLLPQLGAQFSQLGPGSHIPAPPHATRPPQLSLALPQQPLQQPAPAGFAQHGSGSLPPPGTPLAPSGSLPPPSMSRLSSHDQTTVAFVQYCTVQEEHPPVQQCHTLPPSLLSLSGQCHALSPPPPPFGGQDLCQLPKQQPPGSYAPATQPAPCWVPQAASPALTSLPSGESSAAAATLMATGSLSPPLPGAEPSRAGSRGSCASGGTSRGHTQQQHQHQQAAYHSSSWAANATLQRRQDSSQPAQQQHPGTPWDAATCSGIHIGGDSLPNPPPTLSQLHVAGRGGEQPDGGSPSVATAPPPPPLAAEPLSGLPSPLDQSLFDADCWDSLLTDSGVLSRMLGDDAGDALGWGPRT